ncbi:MAG: polyhydroxyalkanoate synthesis repressor PhaR [Leptospiraceae bacterium]|nr:MAG: polyhydroxyalkanoate synthesis repressor PhaR [Leptospiraceae bacterium]
MRIIKRYSNRRLYDAKSSQVIHLEDIAEYIKQGEEIKVIDNATGEDITSKVLAQTFLKLVTRNKSEDFKVFLFSSLIREIKENLSNFLVRLIQGGIGTELLSPERLTKIVEEFIGKGDLEIHEKEKYLKEIIIKMNLQQEKILELLSKKLLNENKEIIWDIEIDFTF